MSACSTSSAAASYGSAGVSAPRKLSVKLPRSGIVPLTERTTEAYHVAAADLRAGFGHF